MIVGERGEMGWRPALADLLETRRDAPTSRPVDTIARARYTLAVVARRHLEFLRAARRLKPVQPLRLAVIYDYAEEGSPTWTWSARCFLRSLWRAIPTRSKSRASAQSCPPREPRRGGARMRLDPARLIAYCSTLTARSIASSIIRACCGVCAATRHLSHRRPQLRPFRARGLRRAHVVTCHDLDAFRCLLASGAERRSLPFRMIAQQTLSGMRSAAHVCSDSVATRDALSPLPLVSSSRLVVFPNGAHPACSSRPIMPPSPRPRFCSVFSIPEWPNLHVGTPPAHANRRIAAHRRRRARASPNLRPIKAGGALAADQNGWRKHWTWKSRSSPCPFSTRPTGRALSARRAGAGAIGRRTQDCR